MLRMPDEFDRLRWEERASRFGHLWEDADLEDCPVSEDEDFTLRSDGGDDWPSALSEAANQLLERIKRRLKESARIEALEAQVRTLSAKMEEMERHSLVFPCVVSTPDVCGGSPRLIRTRIPIWVLQQMRERGFSDSKILESYPTLMAGDLAQAWGYVALHKAQIVKEIEENERY